MSNLQAMQKQTEQCNNENRNIGLQDEDVVNSTVIEQNNIKLILKKY